MDVAVAPVKLKYAISQFFAGSETNNAYTYIKVKVQNFVEPKLVEFIYKGPDGKWNTEPLALEASFGDYELFGSMNASHTEEFAIQYTVDNTSYWDSNHGVNYKVINNNIIGGNVMLNQAIAKVELNKEEENTTANSWIEGEIFTRKISYNKRVGIRFSLDDGQSWKEVDALYKGVEIEGAYKSLFKPSVEVWKFQTPAYNYDDAADILRFVVYYKNEETGEWYWDNNFGQDYKLSKVDGSILE